MADPKSARHRIDLDLVIDGKHYGCKPEPLLATRPAEVEKLASELADLIRNTVRNHFGLALTAFDVEVPVI